MKTFLLSIITIAIVGCASKPVTPGSQIFGKWGAEVAPAADKNGTTTTHVLTFEEGKVTKAVECKLKEGKTLTASATATATYTDAKGEITEDKSVEQTETVQPAADPKAKAKKVKATTITCKASLEKGAFTYRLDKEILFVKFAKDKEEQKLIKK